MEVAVSEANQRHGLGAALGESCKMRCIQYDWLPVQVAVNLEAVSGGYFYLTGGVKPIVTAGPGLSFHCIIAAWMILE